MNKLLPLIVIVGPTAVGKTEVGIRVAEKIGGEIISGDSMQIYRHMDIGTAKPTPEEMGGIPHYMMDIMNPDENFSVAMFQQEVDQYIRHISAKGKLPLLVGGTGLYVRSVLDHYDFSPPGEAPEIRERFLRLSEEKGNQHLVDLLKEVDPASAERIHLNDTRRLVRALEVYHSLGRPITEFQYNTEEMPPKYDFLYYGLTMERQLLYQRIEQRIDQMVAKGLVDEVKNLLQMGFSLQNTSMQAIGYKEIVDHLKGLYSLDEAIELIKRNTRRFAKRQLTWFRRDQRINWKIVDNCHSLEEIAVEIVRQVEGHFYQNVEVKKNKREIQNVLLEGNE